MKISEWLSTRIASHDISDSRRLLIDFTKEVGPIEGVEKLQAPWPEHTPAATRRAIYARGFGGALSTTPAEKLCWGYEVAEALARLYAPGYTCTKRGRGFIYHEALDALKNAGQ